MALTTTKVGGNSGTTTSLGSGTLSPTVAAGDLLIAYITQGTGGALFTGVTDNSGSGSWTQLGVGANSASTEGVWLYKVANGSETTVTASFSSSAAADMVVTNTTGWVNAPSFEDEDENVSHITTAITTSPIAMGTVTSTTASAVVIAWIGSDGLGTITTGRGVSDGASYTETADQGTQIYCYAHEKSSTGTFSPSFSYSDTGDQVYAASAVFGDSSGGSSYTLTVDKGDLTLSGKAITFNASLGVTEGDLTATGQAIAFAQTLTVGNGTLTLAGQDVTLTVSGSYTLPVDKGALTLAAQTVTFDLGFGVTKQDLALAGSAATFGSALLIDGGTLTLTGQNVTLVTDALPEEAPVVIGGHYFPTVKLNDWKERSAKQRREFLERLLGLVEDMPEVVEEEIQELIEAQNIVSLDTARVSRLIAQIERILEDEDETVFLLMAS